MFNFSGGVNQNQNGLDPTAFNKPQAGTQGQYNPLELLMRLMQQKKQEQMPNMQNMRPMQEQNEAGVNFPDFKQGMMPRGAMSPNGQIMPNFKGLLG